MLTRSLGTLDPTLQKTVTYFGSRRISTLLSGVIGRARLLLNSTNFFGFSGCRFYNPRSEIDWVKIRLKQRAHYIHRTSSYNKLRTHSRMNLRFRLTRFGWERLRACRNSAHRYNWSAKKWRRMMKPTLVHQHDIPAVEFNISNRSLRRRNPPKDTNPNIRKIRNSINSHFG